MNWAGIALAASVLVIVLAAVYVIAVADMKLERHTRHKKVRREFDPPEPPEGRYWG